MAPRAWAAWRCCWTAEAEAGLSRSGQPPQTASDPRAHPAPRKQDPPPSRLAPASTGMNARLLMAAAITASPASIDRQQRQRPQARDKRGKTAGQRQHQHKRRQAHRQHAGQDGNHQGSWPRAAAGREPLRRPGRMAPTPPAPPAARPRSADKAARAKRGRGQPPGTDRGGEQSRRCNEIKGISEHQRNDASATHKARGILRSEQGRLATA